MNTLVQLFCEFLLAASILFDDSYGEPGEDDDDEYLYFD